MLRIVFLATFIISSFGCARKPPYTTVSYGASLPSRSPEVSIDVYSASKPAGLYKEIGEVKTTTTEPQIAMERILIGARKLGADGVIMVGPAGVVHSRSTFPGKAVKSKEYGIRAIAFVYTDSAGNTKRITR